MKKCLEELWGEIVTGTCALWPAGGLAEGQLDWTTAKVVLSGRSRGKQQSTNSLNKATRFPSPCSQGNPALLSPGQFQRGQFQRSETKGLPNWQVFEQLENTSKSLNRTYKRAKWHTIWTATLRLRSTSWSGIKWNDLAANKKAGGTSRTTKKETL